MLKKERFELKLKNLNLTKEEYFKSKKLVKSNKTILQPIKSKIHRYKKDDILKSIEMLKEEYHPKDIEEVTNISVTQIKKIRQILKKGKQEDINLLLECKYLISSILRNILN